MSERLGSQCSQVGVQALVGFRESTSYEDSSSSLGQFVSGISFGSRGLITLTLISGGVCVWSFTGDFLQSKSLQGPTPDIGFVPSEQVLQGG